jgi:hypothetical protein
MDSIEAFGRVFPDSSELSIGTVLYGMLSDAFRQGKLGFRFSPPFQSDLREVNILASFGEHNARGFQWGASVFREGNLFEGVLLFCQCEACLVSQGNFAIATSSDFIAQGVGSQHGRSQRAAAARNGRRAKSPRDRR